MGDRNPKQKEKLKKQHAAEMARKQAVRESHTHRFSPEGGPPHQEAHGDHNKHDHNNNQHHHKKAG